MKNRLVAILILIVALCVSVFSGCVESKSLRIGFGRPSSQAREGLFSCGAYSDNKNEFDIDNIELDFYFGHKGDIPSSFHILVIEFYNLENGQIRLSNGGHYRYD